MLKVEVLKDKMKISLMSSKKKKIANCSQKGERREIEIEKERNDRTEEG